MAYLFDGTVDHIIQSSGFPLDGPNGSTKGSAFSVWFKTTTITGQRVLGCSDTGSGSDWEQLAITQNYQATPLVADVQDVFWVYLRDNDGHVRDFDFTFPNSTDGGWHNLVCSVNPEGTAFSVWVDGVGASVAYRISNNPDHGCTFAQPLAIGTINANGTPETGFEYNGSIAEVSFFDDELNAAQAIMLSIGINPLSIPNTTLHSYSPLLGPQDVISGDTWTLAGDAALDQDHPPIYRPSAKISQALVDVTPAGPSAALTDILFPRDAMPTDEERFKTFITDAGATSGIDITTDYRNALATLLGYTEEQALTRSVQDLFKEYFESL